MRVLIAPDKFKGSLTAAEVAAALAVGIASARPDWVVDALPVADGGDGTVDAALAAGWDRLDVATVGPTGGPRTVAYAVRGDAAVVELASAVGMQALPGGVPDPVGASTFGLGTVVGHALDHGARRVVLALGGSASTDGGAGLLQGLGARIRDSEGRDLPVGGGALARAATLDLTGLHPAVAHAGFEVACDVDNPLLGPEGAAAVFAPQKGASVADVRVLEAAMSRWAEAVRAATGRDEADEPGAGAAGGTGFGAMSVLCARRRRGIDVVFELTGFDARLADADLVITGEGSLDEQSLRGKAPVGVAAAARARGIPVVAVAGRITLSRGQLEAAGFTAAHTLAELEPDRDRSMLRAAELLREVGRRVAAETG
ncbi:glycerate kinase [Speluncibacter jeojiensis]|uniref:Glycerate kinase n=1 Tax=Speluncibacter jeojiensis TaxID=2710754 RepID=A0A9X4M0C6_9ACTN|nr:glycerate kinase [Corynebacteriales bacterium D3-21]